MHFRKLVQWIREEFEAAPNLRLTTREAAAFFGLDLDTCDRVLSQLLSAGALTRGPDGRFLSSQFSSGRSMESITRTSTGPRADSSLRPSCS